MRRYLWVLYLLFLFWTQWPVLCSAAEWDLSSETILRTFQRNTVKGDDRNILPLYEHLRIGYGDSEAGGLAFQGYGWIRRDLTENDFYQDDPDGELLYAYLTYARPRSSYKICLGRQHIFAGAANESVDGLRVDLNMGGFVSLSVYGGIPVDLEDTNGRAQDTIYGGRAALLFAPSAEFGLSYKNLRDNGEDQEQTVGADFSWSPSRYILLDGRSGYNLETQGFREHDYSAQITVNNFEVTPQFQYFQYEDYFSTAENRNNLFRFLFDSDEILTSWGADLSWSGLKKLTIGLHGRRYAYDIRATTALFVSGFLTVNITSDVTMGAEAGRMDGQTPEDSYQLYRTYCAWSAAGFLGPAGEVSVDLLYQSFDEAIYGVDTALFAALSTGRNVFNERSFIKASLNYSQDPLFDDDISGVITFLISF